MLIDLFVAWRNVVRHGRRSLVGAAAIIAGTVALILAAGFIEWIFWGMREGTIRSGLGHIQVMRAGYLERASTDPFSHILPQGSREQEVVQAAPHVLAVAPRLKFTGLISVGDSTLSFLGSGTVPEVEARFDNVTAMDSGQLLSSADRAGILLGSGLASNLGAKVGDRAVLLVTRPGGALGGVEATVRGIFSTVTKAYDDMAVHVTLDLADELLQAGGAHTWVVYLDDTGRTRFVTERLRQSIGTGLLAVPWYESADFYNKTVRLFSRQVLVMKIIIALVVVLSISNTMMMSVMERTNEIATAMALGLRRRQVLSRFLLEGLLIGLLGGSAGIALGYLLAEVISAIGIPMPPPPGMERSYVGEILVTPALVRDAVILAAATALVASAYPAWKASRMVVADALRHGR